MKHPNVSLVQMVAIPLYASDTGKNQGYVLHPKQHKEHIMAKKSVAEMTPEEVAKKHELSKERRQQRRENQLKAISEITALLTDEQIAGLSDNAKHCIAVWSQEYKPGVQIEVHKGQTLEELFKMYGDVKDAYRKIEKRVAEAGLKINFQKGCIE